MKINPLKLAAVLLLLVINFKGQAQKQPVKQITYHNPFSQHDHRNCGIDHVSEKLANQNPEYARELEDFKRIAVPALSGIETDRAMAPVIYVPVVVHVIHSGETIGTGANLSEARIQAQIDVLNAAFAAENANYNSTPAQWQSARGVPEIQFCLAIIDPDGDPSSGITRHNMAITVDAMGEDNIETEIKPATTWDSNRYYNIYTLAIPGTTANGGTTGYAYYPTNSIIGSDLDGSVVDYRWFGGPGFGQSGDGTLTHETGHYLGLPHTFDGLSCAADDGITDTPEIDSSSAYYMPFLNCNSSFPTGPISCGNEHMYVNYMDYVNDDDCSTSFTNGQVNVMRAVMEGSAIPGSFNYGSRLNLANNALTACSFFEEDAGIVSIVNPQDKICMDGNVTPIVTLQNYGTNVLTTVTIRYQVNGGTPVDFIWVDNLGTGANQEVTLAPFTPPANDYSFEVYTVNPNGTGDGQTVNDSMEVVVSTIVPTNLPLNEDFEDVAWNPSANGIFPFNNSGDSFEWQRTTAASGFGTGGASAVFNNYSNSGGSNPGGTVDALITSVYDFSGVTSASLSFDVAYTPYDNSFFDSLKIYVSTDCGATFDQLIFADGNTGLATAPATTALFTPSANEWENYNLSLSAFDNEANVTVAFINASGYGNQLFLDNINISMPVSCNLSVAPNNSELACNSICDGSASVNLSGGTGTINYQWDANAANSTDAQVTGLCAGTYSVTVTDVNMCTAETTVIISEPPALNVSATATNETLPNTNDGTATAMAMGGNGLISYVWSNGSTAAMISNLSPGSYTVTVTDSNMCTDTETIEVEAFDCGGFVVSATATAVQCFGEQNGSVTAIAENGTGTANYIWSNGATTATIENLAPGDYSVTATDPNGCTSTFTSTVEEPDNISVTVNQTNESALDANDGTATATATGGAGGFSYAWSNLDSGTMIESLAPGNYTVTITDANSCSATEVFIIDEFICETITVELTPSNITCFGEQDGSILSSVSGGSGDYSYTWSNGSTTANIENLTAGTYQLTVTDSNGCTGTASAEITSPFILNVEVETTNETLNNGNDGTAIASLVGGTAGYTFLWNTMETSQTISGLTPGTYCVTVTDQNNCSVESCGVVNAVGCSLDISFSSTNATCFGENDGSATIDIISGTDPITYSWSNGGTTASVTNLDMGAYSVTVTDALSCEVIEQFMISEPNPLGLMMSSTPPSSNGVADGTATAMAMGGTPDYTYVWSNGIIGESNTNLSPGIYEVTVTDSNDCTTVNEVEISDPSVDCSGFSGVIESTNVSCFGAATGVASVSLTGGSSAFTYLWSTGATNAIIDGLVAGNYSVTVTDANDCQIILNTEITQSDEITVEFETTPATGGNSDGSITALPSGGVEPYSYTWGIGGLTTQTISNVPSGLYSMTVTDASNCSILGSVLVNDLAPDCTSFTGDISKTDISCFGMQNGSAEVAFMQGGVEPYQYLWNTNETGSAISGLSAGEYFVSVIDGNNCVLDFNIDISQPEPITITFTSISPSGSPVNDGSATANPEGGMPPYSYNWSNGATTPTIEQLGIGIYVVTVIDANQCLQVNEVELQSTVVDCNDFEIEIEEVAIFCNGFENGVLIGSTTGGTAPVSWSWSNEVTSNVNSGLGAGTYSVTATDAEGCEALSTYTLTEPSAITTSISSIPVSTNGAADGSATVSVMGGEPPYSYLWTNGETTATINNLTTGLYQVEITDALGCVVLESIVIGIDGEVCSDFALVNIEAFDVNCFGGFDGGATVSITGGTEPFTYIWSNGALGAEVNSFQQGVYQVTITDNNNCQVEGEVEISQPMAGLQATYGTTAESSPGAMDGSATVTITGGTPPFTYNWGEEGNTQNLENVSAGQYEYEITDANGCMHTIFIIIPGTGDECGDFELVSEFGNVSCNGAADGIIVTSASGGLMPFTYEWSNEATDATLFDLEPGTYSVTVTDGEGCVAMETFVITENPPISLTVSSTDETIAQLDGTATATALGGAGNFTYEWSNEETTQNIEDLAPGTYTLTVTDEAGCTAEEEVIIAPFTGFCDGYEGTIESTGIDCNGDMDGSATAQGIGGTIPYTYLWSNGSENSIITNLSGGIYLVTITDANQCVIVLETEVQEFAEMQIEVQAFNGACGIGGSANALVTGGTMDYTYQWSNGGTDNTISDLADGIYMVTVSDSNGCTVMGETQVQNNTSGLLVESEIEMVSCSGESDGSINLTVVEGLAPYTYSWNNGAITEDLDDLPSGEYTVLVTDSQNCSYLTTFDLTAPAELVADIDWTPAGSGSDGTAMANAFGGITPYSYSWSTGSTASQIDNLEAGNYSLTVTDANGCTTETSVFIGITSADELSELESLAVMPNPSNGIFVLNAEFSSSQDGMIQVYNLIGQKVYTQAFTAQNMVLDIDLSNQSAGSYFLVIRTKEGQITRKLILSK